MNRIFAIFLALVLPLMMSAAEYDFIHDGIYYQYNNDKTGMIVVGEFLDPNPYTGDIVIPDYIFIGDASIPVISISIHAFSHSGITSISLPSTLKSISIEAFYDCDKLESVVIPDGVVSIDGGCFGGCDNLRSVTFPTIMKENDFGTPPLGGIMFNNCKKLESVRLPDNLKVLGSSFFNNCVSLKKVNLPGQLEIIETWAFSNSGVETITIPGTVTAIGKEAFKGCKDLKEIAFEDGETVLKFVEALDRGDDYFFTTEVLETLYVGRNIEMDYWSGENLGTPFRNLSKVIDFRLGNNVTKIEPLIFRGLSSLEKLVIPAGVKSIGSGSFMNFGISGEKTVECLGSEPARLAVDAFSNECYDLCHLTVPAGSEELYKNAEGWSRFFQGASVAEVTENQISWRKEDGGVHIIADDGFTATVTDLCGRVVYAGGSDLIDLPGHGVYVLRIDCGTDSKVFKISL